MTLGPFTLPPSVDEDLTVMSGFWSRRLGFSADWAPTRGVAQFRATAHSNAAAVAMSRIRTARVATVQTWGAFPFTNQSNDSRTTGSGAPWPPSYSR